MVKSQASISTAHDLKHLGSDNLDDLVGSSAPANLALAQNVTSEILRPRAERPEGPRLDEAKVLLPKAAIASFQCWETRNANIVGVLLGIDHKRSGGSAAVSIVVGYNWMDLLSDPRVSQVCKEEGAQVCGAVLSQSEDMNADRERALQFLTDIERVFGITQSICVGVAGLFSGAF